MYFSAGDMDYWYETKGKGIPVVLLHGFTGSSATWEAFIASAPAGIQSIVIDLPGHGKTKGNSIKTMEACCADIQQLLQQLQIEAFYLLGYSLGGRTALTLAVNYPEMVKGLILESASPGLKENSEREERRENDEKLAERIRLEGIETFVEYWESIPLFATQKSLPREIQLKIREERRSQRSEGLANSLYGMGTGAQASNWEKLNNINCPVLLIAGELDTKFVQINKQMAEQISNAQLEIIEGAGHAVHIEKPEVFNDRVIAFAKS